MRPVVVRHLRYTNREWPRIMVHIAGTHDTRHDFSVAPDRPVTLPIEAVRVLRRAYEYEYREVGQPGAYGLWVRTPRRMFSVRQVRDGCQHPDTLAVPLGLRCKVCGAEKVFATGKWVRA